METHEDRSLDESWIFLSVSACPSFIFNLWDVRFLFNINLKKLEVTNPTQSINSSRKRPYFSREFASSDVFAMSASLRHNQLEQVKRGKNDQIFVSVNSCLSSFACSDIFLSISKEVVCFANLFTPRNVRSPFKDEIHCFLLYSTAWEWPNASLPKWFIRHVNEKWSYGKNHPHLLMIASLYNGSQIFPRNSAVVALKTLVVTSKMLPNSRGERRFQGSWVMTNPKKCTISLRKSMVMLSVFPR